MLCKAVLLLILPTDVYADSAAEVSEFSRDKTARWAKCKNRSPSLTTRLTRRSKVECSGIRPRWECAALAWVSFLRCRSRRNPGMCSSCIPFSALLLTEKPSATSFAPLLQPAAQVSRKRSWPFHKEAMKWRGETFRTGHILVKSAGSCNQQYGQRCKQAMDSLLCTVHASSELSETL